jgi:L-2-hydroxycarboxylate dehydrogenase (NAD+)
MRISYKEVSDIVKNVLRKWGFPEPDVEVIFKNMWDAELSGKKSHSFTNLFWYKDVIDGKYGPLNIAGNNPEIGKETKVSLVIDGQEKTGYVVMDYALNLSLKKAKEIGLVTTTLTRTAPTIGFIGSYVKKATDNGYIFLCFSNAGKSTAPYGTTKKIFGTNPIAIGVPTNTTPIILDMATAATTYANLLRSKALGKQISENVGLDAKGELTNNPDAILSGGCLIPFGGYKGSGISLMVEILAGALTGAKTGLNNVSYWGTTFMLLDPSLFGEANEFYERVNVLRDEIKSASKRPGFEEIYLPGEKSLNKFKESSGNDEIEIDDNFMDRVKAL